MDKLAVFGILKNNISSILPDLRPEDIQYTDSLRNLGANSIDRADILIQTMQQLQIRMPMVEFSKARNIQELTEILHARLP